jgi:hypothetical protein
MHLDVMLAQTFLITSLTGHSPPALRRFLQPHRAPSGCVAGLGCGAADGLAARDNVQDLELQILGDAIGDLSGKAINRANMKCPLARCAAHCVVWCAVHCVVLSGLVPGSSAVVSICATQHICHTWRRHQDARALLIDADM